MRVIAVGLGESEGGLADSPEDAIDMAFDSESCDVMRVVRDNARVSVLFERCREWMLRARFLCSVSYRYGFFKYLKVLRTPRGVFSTTFQQKVI